MFRKENKIKSFYNKHFIGIEMVLSFVLSLAIFFVLKLLNLEIDNLFWQLLLFAFIIFLPVITMLNLILSKYLEYEKFTIVRNSIQFEKIQEVFQEARLVLLGGIVWLFPSFFIDIGIYGVGLYFLIFGAFRIGRCIWVADNIIKILNKNFE